MIGKISPISGKNWSVFGCMPEIFEMVNDALYTYLEIPAHYQPYMPTFFPREDIRKQFNIKIPKKYLERELSIQRI